jgi:biotin carboxylase
VPRSKLVETARQAVEFAQEVGYPCVLKPRRSYIRVGAQLSHRRHQVIQGPDEMRAAFAAAKSDEPPIVQELVQGRALSVGAVRRAGRLLAAVVRETFTFHPVAGGTSVWKRTVSSDEGGVQEALSLLADIEYEGLGEVEYQLEQDGTPRLMEIGVRAFAWLPLAAAAGADLSLLAAEAACGVDPLPLETYRPGVEMRWPAGELLRLRDAAAGAVPVGVSRFDVVRSIWPPWRPGMRYDGIARDDWRPWIPARIRRYAPLHERTTVGAACRAPRTKRDAGPNLPSAAKPTKYNPGTDD